MVQVDVFWSYGIGASFALAAHRQLRSLRAKREGEKWKIDWWDKPNLIRALKEAKKRAREKGALTKQDNSRMRKLIEELMEKNAPAFQDEYFVKTLLFLSLLFVPSGAVLLWGNPSWETMQVGEYETISKWLVGAFTATNVTQGILGYLVTYNYLMQGKYFKAALQPVLAYLGFFFILVNGWDNRGYQRFFSRDRKSFERWDSSGRAEKIRGFITSDVVRILLFFGMFFLPLMYYWIINWIQQGYYEEKGIEPDSETMLKEAAGLFSWLNLVIFGYTLGSAIAATILIRKFGWIPGLAVAAALSYLVGMSKWGAGPELAKRVLRLESLEGEPVEPLFSG